MASREFRKTCYYFKPGRDPTPWRNLMTIKKLEEVWKDVDPEEHSHIKKEMERKVTEDKQNNRLNT